MQRALAIVAISSACLTVGWPAVAAEPAEPEPIPEGTSEAPPATEPAKELEGQGRFGTAVERPEEEEEAGDALEWDISFGMLLSTGNARMLSMNASTNFLLRRDRHQLTAVGLGNYGRAAPAGAPNDAELQTTLGNVQGRVRYDIFLSRQWSLFAMATARHDPFQYLGLRLNIDPGVAWYVLTTAKQRLTAEAGYDYQLDLRTDDAVVRDPAGEPVLDAMGAPMPLARRRDTHAVRLAGSYVNLLSDSLTFRTGLEYLQSVQDAVRWRINWDVGLTTNLFRSLSLATTFNLRIDNDPLPGVREVDTVTALSLVYRFF